MRNKKPLNMTFERLLDQGGLEAWNSSFEKIITDPDDREPMELLRERLADPDRNAFHSLYDDKNKLVGIELINFDPEIPGAMYVPYAGLTSDYRNMGLYPQFAKVSDQQMREVGAKYSLYDFEDPARVPDYLDTPGEAAKVAEKRVNFWRRSVNCFVVDDPDIPYVRPMSSDEQEIQAYDLLSIRALGNDWGPVKDNLKEKGLKSPLFNHEDPSKATAMSKEAYRLLYLEMSRLQFGNLSEAELRAKFPAIELFVSTLDKCPKQWVSMVMKDVVAKDLNVKPDVDAKIAINKQNTMTAV